MRAGVDAQHARLDDGGAAFQGQAGALADAHGSGVGWGDGRFNLQLAQVHDFHDACVQADAFAGLGQALRNQAGQRRLERGVVHRLARHVERGHGSQVAGLGAAQVGQRCVQRGFGNEALIDQRLVVVELLLRDFHLRHRRVDLPLRLALASQVFGRVNARHDLTLLDPVAFAQREVHQLTDHACFDHGRVHRFERAGHRQALRQRLGLGHDDVGGRQLQSLRHHLRGLGRCGRGLRSRFALHIPLVSAESARQDNNRQQNAAQINFHGFNVLQPCRVPTGWHGG